MGFRIVAVLVLCVGLAAGESSAAIVGPFSAVVDFDGASDLNDFTSLADPLGVNGVNAAGGAGSDGAVGRLRLSPGTGYTAGQRVLYYTPAANSGGLIQLTPFGSATLSLDFLPEATTNVNVTSGAVPRIGFNEQSATTALNNNALLVLPQGNASKTLTVRTVENGATTNDAQPMDLSLSAGVWHRLGVTLTKTDTTNVFDYEAYLSTLDPSGNILSVLRTENGSFSNATFYDDGFYGFLNYQILASPPNVAAQFTDNFQLTVTAIPEPSTWVLTLSALLLGAVLSRQKFRKARAQRV